MHIVFANRYYAPDTAATSLMISDLAAHLADQGHAVEAITSRQYYDRPAAHLPPLETLSGVRVRRVWTSTFGRRNLLGRALDYLSFYASFFFTCLITLRRGSVLVCCTDPPLLSIPAALACALTRSRLVNWLQDVYPETAVALGVMSERSLLTRVLARLRNLSLRLASRNVVLGELMARKVQGFGVDPQQITVIHNWSLTPAKADPRDPSASRLRRNWGLADRFVVAYSGNLGRAHEIETLLQAAQILREERTICFLMIGAGYYWTELQSRVAELSLDNFAFKPYQPLAILAGSLAVADIHLVILRPELEGYIVPSKFYGAAASGRPVIFLGSPEGEVARILAREKAGASVAAGDGAGLARLILQMRDNPAARGVMGANARRMCTTAHSRADSLQQWARIL